MVQTVTADGQVNHGAAAQIECENKALKAQYVDAIEEAFKKNPNTQVACKITNSTFVLAAVATYFRSRGYECAYDPDKEVLTVGKEIIVVDKPKSTKGKKKC